MIYTNENSITIENDNNIIGFITYSKNDHLKIIINSNHTNVTIDPDIKSTMKPISLLDATNKMIDIYEAFRNDMMTDIMDNGAYFYKQDDDNLCYTNGDKKTTHNIHLSDNMLYMQMYDKEMIDMNEQTSISHFLDMMDYFYECISNKFSDLLEKYQ